MTEVQGHCDPKFEKVRTLLEDYIASGQEVGASIVVNIDGKDVIDIWGGYANESRTRKWEKDTIVNVWSTTKTVSSLAALMCVDRGLLDVDEKVATYWPEFGVNGKENVLVRHVLSHTSGVAAWEPPVTLDDICDLQASTARLVEQAPWWEPGSASGYQSLSMGHLIGELVRRVTGKSLTQFVAEEIAGPLEADFQIGALEKDWPRIAELIAPPPVDLGEAASDSLALKIWLSPSGDPEFAHSRRWREAEIGAANGHGNARSVNRMLSVISLGGKANGKQLLSPETIKLIFRQQYDGIDLAFRVRMCFGIGFALNGENTLLDWISSKHACFWGGWGGSTVVMDLDRRMTISYMMNKMGPGLVGSDRTEAYSRAIYAALAD